MTGHCRVRADYMNDHIMFDGKKFISANTAALSSELSRDYVARLCREGKVLGRRIGTHWYVNEESFGSFLVKQEYAKRNRRDGLARERGEEYRAATSDTTRSTSRVAATRAPRTEAHALLARALEKHSDRVFAGAVHAASAPAGIAHAAFSAPHVPVHAIAPLTELVQKLTALALALALTLGTYALVDPQYARYAANTVASDMRSVFDTYRAMADGTARARLSRIESRLTIGAEHPSMVAGAAAAAVADGFARFARAVHANVDAVVYSVAFPERVVQSLGIVPLRASVIVHVEPTARSESGVASEAQSASHSSPAAPLSIDSDFGGTQANLTVAPVRSAAPRTIIAAPTIERVVEKQTILMAGGITENILATRLQELDNKLSAKIFNLTSANSSSPYVPAPIITLAQATRIDSLSGVSLSGSAWTGGTITDASISGGSVAASALLGAVSIAQGGTGTTTTPSYGQLLLGNAQGGYDLVATSSLGIAGGGGGTWGSITGTLSNQTDLQSALDGKLSLTTWYATTTTALAEGANLYFTSARATSTFIQNLAATTSVASLTTLPNLSLPYAQLTGAPTSMASSTLLSDSNTWSGANTFSTTATSSFAGPLETAGFNAGAYFFGAGLSLCGGSNKLTWSGGSFGCAIDQTGGGSGGGSWSTTTSQVAGQLINYSNNSTDIVTIGNNATTTAPYWFNPNTLVAYLSGKVGIGTTSPFATLSVAGDIFANSSITGSNLTATGTLSVSGNTSLAAATSTTFAITGVTSALLSTNAGGSVVATTSISTNLLSANTIALSTGSTGTDINVSGSPATLGGTLTLNIPTASASNRGLLSSADWTTFNSKQAALAFTYPLLNSANTISLAFGTTTSNTWAGTQTFTNTIAGSITGNAGTATALQSARTINGTSFDGTANITITAASSTLLADSNTWSGANAFQNVTATGATSTTFAITGVTSALHLANSTGGVIAYTGTSCTNQFVRSVNGAGAATCASVQDEDLNLSDITLADFTNDANYAKTTVANAWTALQSFGNASTTLLSVFTKAYFGGTATSTFSASGNLTLANAANMLTLPFLATPAGTFLAADASGNIIATTTPAGGGSGTVGSGTTGQFPYYAANGTTLTATSSLFLATSGNVGIGTTTPQTQFHLYGTSASTNFITARIQNTTADGGAYLNLLGDSGLSTGIFRGGSAYTSYGGANSLNIYQGNNAPIAFITNNSATPQMVLTGSGNVGIGTTTPWGLLSINPNALGSGVPEFVVGSTTATHLLVTGAGNVGVGTTSPLAKLDVYGDAILSGASRYFNFGAISGTTGYGFRDNGGTMQVKNNAGSWTNIPTSGTTQWTTSGSNIYYNTGKVGIGTVSPGEELTVAYLDGADSALRIEGNSTTYKNLELVDTTSGEEWQFSHRTDIEGNAFQFTYFNGSTWYNRMTINSSGLVGIGTTTPWGKLSLHANDGETNTTLFAIASSTASATTTHFVVTNAGNVGIGTSTPQARLSVLESTEIDAAAFAGNKTSGVRLSLIPTNTGGVPYRIQATADSSIFGGGKLVFVQSTTARMTLSGSNFGIGTTTPWGKLSLHANDGETNTTLFAIASSTASATTTHFVVTNAGNVGLGTTTPLGNLTIAGSSNWVGLRGYSSTRTNGFYMDFFSASTTMAGGGKAGGFVLNDDQNASPGLAFKSYDQSFPIFFATSHGGGAETTRLTISTNGNVGIGTTTPFRLLSMTSAVSTAQAAIAYDTANNTDILTSSVGDLFLYPSGNDALFNNSNLWVCTGGTGATNGCPSGTPSGFGNLIVETALGVGSSTPFAALSLGANMAVMTTEKSLSDGATIAIDWKNGNQQVVTLGGNRAVTFSNYISGATLRLVLCQDGTGSRTITSWPAAVLWSGGSAPTLTTTANKCDVLTFLTTSATGTVRVLGSSVLNF